jgi:hypothetical protein
MTWGGGGGGGLKTVGSGNIKFGMFHVLICKTDIVPVISLGVKFVLSCQKKKPD